MQVFKLTLTTLAFSLVGCATPSNVLSDLKYSGDPTYDACRRKADALSDYGAKCAHETDLVNKAWMEEQLRQSAAEEEKARILAEEQSRQLRVARRNGELAKGYLPIAVRDLVLDGKILAAQRAKRSLTGAYLPVGDLDLLFQSGFDAIQFSNGQNPNSPYVHLLVANSSREFRSQLLDCRSNPGAVYAGCQLHLLGTVTFCTLSDVLGVRRDVPCFSVEDGDRGY